MQFAVLVRWLRYFTEQAINSGSYKNELLYALNECRAQLDGATQVPSQTRRKRKRNRTDTAADSRKRSKNRQQLSGGKVPQQASSGSSCEVAPRNGTTSAANGEYEAGEETESGTGQAQQDTSFAREHEACGEKEGQTGPPTEHQDINSTPSVSRASCGDDELVEASPLQTAFNGEGIALGRATSYTTSAGHSNVGDVNIPNVGEQVDRYSADCAKSALTIDRIEFRSDAHSCRDAEGINALDNGLHGCITPYPPQTPASIPTETTAASLSATHESTTASKDQIHDKEELRMWLEKFQHFNERQVQALLPILVRYRIGSAQASTRLAERVASSRILKNIRDALVEPRPLCQVHTPAEIFSNIHRARAQATKGLVPWRVYARKGWQILEREISELQQVKKTRAKAKQAHKLSNRPDRHTELLSQISLACPTAESTERKSSRAIVRQSWKSQYQVGDNDWDDFEKTGRLFFSLETKLMANITCVWPEDSKGLFETQKLFEEELRLMKEVLEILRPSLLSERNSNALYWIVQAFCEPTSTHFAIERMSDSEIDALVSQQAPLTTFFSAAARDNGDRIQWANNQVSRSPSPPRALLVPEHLLRNIKFYFEQSCQNMIFDDYGSLLTSNGAKLHNDLCDNFDSYCFTASMLKAKGSHVGVRHALSKASALVGKILQAEHPRTLACFLEVFIHLIQTGLPEVTFFLRDYIKRMSTEVTRKEHPWGQICWLLGELESESLDQAMVQIWKCTTDIFDSELGTFSRFAVSARLDYIKRVITNCCEEERLLRDILARFGDTPRLPTPRVMLNLAHNLNKLGRYNEAEEMALEVLSLLREHEIYVGRIVEGIESLKVVSRSQYNQGKRTPTHYREK